MHCHNCGRLTEDARVLSEHRVADGLVRYRECPCGTVSVELLEYARTSSINVRAANPVAPSPFSS